MINAIEIKRLVKQFDDVLAVNDISLEIKKGEIFSLLGVNGAGKTTMIKILTGLLKPTGGDAILNENSVIHDLDRVKKIINISPQETALALNLTVLENLYFIAGVYEIKNAKNVVEELIKKFNFKNIKNKKAKQLSGGWQRRLSIAMALINDPKILFLDEPTLGLDVLARRELWEIIKGLKGEKTIILTTHYMEEAEMLSDRIGIMVNGNLLKVGTAKEIIENSDSKNLEEAFVKIATGGIE